VTGLVAAVTVIGALVLFVLHRAGLDGSKSETDDIRASRSPGEHHILRGVVRPGRSSDPEAENFDLKRDSHLAEDNTTVGVGGLSDI
jgi:hypothetical protein